MMLRRNGIAEFNGAALAHAVVFRHVRLTSTNPHTDRRFCSEIRLLGDLQRDWSASWGEGPTSKVFDEPGHTWNDAVAGEVVMYVSRPPCLSCLGAILQFKSIYPNVALHVGFRREVTPMASNLDSMGDIVRD